MEKLDNLEEARRIINNEKLSLVYISQPACSVCHGLKPQVEELLESYPDIKAVHLDASEIPEISGEFQVFTVPVVLVYSEGRELIREARFVPVGELDHQLNKLQDAMNA
ncbi:thioredoxin family protein [Salimicrobium halophilum]|uniref:Thioredoxin n=1 Tax=Salimicrobium halophilum TaxID=86666 RepID=A0A1G8UAH6_9BACI|nr:thioredoxin family protein [Salimicrobium halophilum]SDJ50175.1 Thioredoxin [Salimicrobium halophilum]